MLGPIIFGKSKITRKISATDLLLVVAVPGAPLHPLEINIK